MQNLLPDHLGPSFLTQPQDETVNPWDLDVDWGILKPKEETFRFHFGVFQPHQPPRKSRHSQRTKRLDQLKLVKRLFGQDRHQTDDQRTLRSINQENLLFLTNNSKDFNNSPS